MRMPRIALSAALLVAASLGVATPAAAAEPVTVKLLSIADFHGQLAPPPANDGGQIPGPNGSKVTVGGAAYLATHLKNLRADAENSMLIAAGDQFSGWPFTVEIHRDEPTVEVLNNLGLDVNGVGNHELDVSRDFLVDHMAKGECFGEIGEDSCFTDSSGQRFHGADFDMSTANVVAKNNGEPILAPYVIKEMKAPDGSTIPVGVISITPPGTEHGSTSYQTDVTTLDSVETLNKYAAELKAKGVNAIVANVHDGAANRSSSASYNDCDLKPDGPLVKVANEASSDIDAIVGGHWHTRFNCTLPDPAGNPRPVVEPGHHGGVINEINLALDPATGEVDRAATTSENHPVTRDVTPDPEMQDIVDYWNEQGDKRFARPVAELDGDFTRVKDDSGESTMGNLTADVNLWTANHSHGGEADFAITMTDPHKGSNAIRADLKVADSGKPGDAEGRVMEGEAWDAYGYNNPVLTVSLTGEQIDAALEQQWTSAKFAPLAVSSNVEYSFSASAPIGSKVEPGDVRIDGEPLDPERTYRVAALAYTLLGSDGIAAFTGFTEAHRNDPPDFLAFIEYLEQAGTLAPAPLDRVDVG
ncbi:bifunctional metallophosphatase/5'-nucleotidase [Stackebrandtia nassauensis]|uniref:5'-Nucleotidase domain protein n=1 Tax=Stackebrandtia nassauensis (strain DSM 44728 / CIP 108903 / NRRL B-16338 / NBRC 102104 / LLR-40K-21) TaxID=446470 RepID=D3Q8P0_STANL|nr:bifunctional UDP-sugar hydrolase/5'-nucleotidase [Stackebrandtia nassauensis]ADD44482.1 5'-Nucleotidase domain protein [Stackebrandtia nassauensis DSM 44728]